MVVVVQAGQGVDPACDGPFNALVSVSVIRPSRLYSRTARRAVAIARDAQRSGMTDDEWWYSVLPTLTRDMSDRFYPLAERVGSAVGAPHTEPDHVFEFGLARILDGVEALVATRTTERS